MNTRWNRIRMVVAVGIIGLLCLPIPAMAIPHTLTVQGTTNTIGTIPSGTPWSASITYDTSISPTSIEPTKVSWNSNPNFDFSFTIGSQNYSFPPLTAAHENLLLWTPFPTRDVLLFQVGSYAFNNIGGNPYGFLRVTISGSNLMLDDLTLPLKLDFSQIQSIELVGSQNTGYKILGYGTNTQLSSTPEPGTMLLFGTGLAGLVACRFKNRRA